MYTKVEKSLPVLYIDDGIPGKFTWGKSSIDEVTISALAEAIQTRTYKVLVLNWTSRAMVLNDAKKKFTGTTDIRRAIEKVRSIVGKMRKKGYANSLIPLIVHGCKLGNRFQGTNLQDYREIIFLARRIIHGRLTNEREAVILARNKDHAARLKVAWKEVRKKIKNIGVRIEIDFRDVLGPLQAREFPDIISLPESIGNKMYIGERELENAEHEFASFMRSEKGLKPKRKKKNMTRFIKVTHPEDESVVTFLTRLTRGRITQLNLYEGGQTGTKELCHPYLDIPEATENCLMI